MCIKIVEHALFRFALDSFVLTSACATTEIVSHNVVFCINKLFVSHILTSCPNLFPALLLFPLHILVLYIFIHFIIIGPSMFIPYTFLVFYLFMSFILFTILFTILFINRYHASPTPPPTTHIYNAP